jgi:myo-inositol-1(or 4)-monophosphatase
MEHLLKTAGEAAKSAGDALLELRHSVQFRQKGPRDLVTVADTEAQRIIQDRIRRDFPGHGFLGEEDVQETLAGHPNPEFVWVVDPLDGTTNYVHGLPFFAVSIALTQHGIPVVGVIYDPLRDRLYTAAKGGGAYENGSRIGVSKTQIPSESLVAASFAADVAVTSPDVHGFLRVLPHARAVRRLGSTALNLAYVAAGQLDAYWSWSCKIWDVAAGVLLVQEAGGSVTGWDGNPPRLFQDSRILAAATPQLHQSLRNLLTEQTTA